METIAKYYSFGYSNVKTYLFALAFVAGNLILPQLCHLTPWGGPVLLPIYFFTLIAAYKYGLWVGLLTAVFSPLCNHWFFGMPPQAMLPIILSKSVLLAVGAAWVAGKYQRLSLLLLLAVILFYQVSGTLVEWLLVKDFSIAIQDFRIGLPGMLLQLFGGYLVLKFLSKQ